VLPPYVFAPDSVWVPPVKTTDPELELDPEMTPAKVPLAFVRVRELEPKRTVEFELAPVREAKLALLLDKLVTALMSNTPLSETELLARDPPPLKTKVE